MSAKRIAFLGPSGTFSEEAALHYDSTAQLLPFASVAAVAAAVDSGMAEEGVVAIENSIEGSVTDTLDILIHESRLSIPQGGDSGRPVHGSGGGGDDGPREHCRYRYPPCC